MAVSEWPPYTSDQMQGAGVATMIAERAFAHDGMRIAVTILPAARALHSTEMGGFDALVIDRESGVWLRDRFNRGLAALVARGELATQVRSARENGHDFEWRELSAPLSGCP